MKEGQYKIKDDNKIKEYMFLKTLLKFHLILTEFSLT